MTKFVLSNIKIGNIQPLVRVSAIYKIIYTDMKQFETKKKLAILYTLMLLNYSLINI